MTNDSLILRKIGKRTAFHTAQIFFIRLQFVVSIVNSTRVFDQMFLVQ